ncbi:MAG: hypothetical protein CMH74_03970 [Nitrospina sp.]|nr:hypothetical protein [Nitrospina sp.]|tara:strand:- start:1245 stop:2039 length:795 start_codon:yes stop_codon:yes gene_type:complete
MRKKKIKNDFFKKTFGLIGNKGLSKNPIGKSVKKFLVENSKNNEVFVNNCRMFLDEKDNMQISLFDYEPSETALVKSTVKKDDIVIDVGANIGYYTLLMAKSDAYVHSYEPELNNFKLLEKNVFENNLISNVSLYNKAVSNFEGFSKLYLSNETTGEHKLNFDRFQNNNFIQVEVTKINLDKIDFAKIDVEGEELHVLQGMKQLPNKIMIEFNPEEIKKSGIDFKDFFQFIEKYKIREITKNGLIEPNFDELIKNPLAVNLFLF